MIAKTPSSLVPKLRFPEFTEHGPWVAKPLDDLCDRLSETVGDAQLTPVSISAGKGFVPQAEKFGRDISGSQYSKYIWLRHGDFAYNRGNSKRFPQGCVYQLTELEEAAASNAFYCFRLHDRFEPAFVLGFFEDNGHGRQLTRHITSGARGNGLLNISADAFFGISIPVPPKATEQRKIAECLRTLDDLIAAESRKLKVLREHKQGLMQQLFPQPGETCPRLRFPEFKDAPGWKEKRLGDLGTLVPGLTYSPSDLRDDGLLVLRSSNVQNGEITLDDCVFVRRDVNGAHLTQPDDILICVRNGSKSLIGKNAIVPRGMPICTHGAFMTVFRAAVPHFARALLQTTAYEKQVAADLGATINSINGSQLLKYRFSVPQAAEQQRIASCVSSLDDVLAAQSQRVAALKAHKQGLQQQLFPSLERQVQ